MWEIGTCACERKKVDARGRAESKYRSRLLEGGSQFSPIQVIPCHRLFGRNKTKKKWTNKVGGTEIAIIQRFLKRFFFFSGYPASV